MTKLCSRKIDMFNDWKYYLHYSLEQKNHPLKRASKQWKLAGRLIATPNNNTFPFSQEQFRDQRY